MFTRFISIYDSSNVEKLAYDPQNEKLIVTYLHSQLSYKFDCPAATFGFIVSAKSIGTETNRLLKDGEKLPASKVPTKPGVINAT